MQKVSNKKCIRRLSFRTIKTARNRNIIAIIAIMLTTILFTSLFTIAMSLVKSFEQQNFRQVGTDTHGSFKNLTDEQLEILKSDELIKESGLRVLLGMILEGPFNKAQVEVSYVDEYYAEHGYIMPEHGRLPKEGTKEAAVDSRVLKLLGIEPELGKEFTVTYTIGSNTDKPTNVTETFTLCGYWDFDEAMMASNVLLPLSYINEVLDGYEKVSDGDITGKTDLVIMFKNSVNINENLNAILNKYGYQSEDRSKDDYIGTGVNWGYSMSQLNRNADIGTIAGMSAILLLIMFSGYLIIYNIFRISVSSDIRQYGLLKTIGTTGKQIKRIVNLQAFVLSAIGIPLGLLFGWLIGTKLTPVIMNTLSYRTTSISVNPIIFVAASIFALITVFLSCRKPSKIAARTSAVEAVRYTEKQSSSKKEKRGEHGGNIIRMALTNMGRSKSKTFLVLISLALSVLLLNATYTFSNGFDMDKYLEKFVCTDFIYGHADYFNNAHFGYGEEGVTEDMIAKIDEQGGILDSGRIYGETKINLQYVPEELVRKDFESYYEPAKVQELMDAQERDENGLVEYRVDLYGMEDFPLSKLEVLDGDLSKMSEEGQIAAVVFDDDYGNPHEDSNHYQVGDKVKIRSIEEYEYIDTTTGLLADENTPGENLDIRYIKDNIKTYTVCARVVLKHTMSYRAYGGEQMILPAKEFIELTKTDTIMTYLLDVDDNSNLGMENFLKDYTENEEISYNYESKEYHVKEFEGFRNMFVLVGSVLSLIVGIIGVLNFINAIITSVISRKREFAVLQAVGMTSKQLKGMLMLEGCYYTVGGVLIAFILNIVLSPLIEDALGSMFWFFSYKFTIAPILYIFPIFAVLGFVIPLIACRILQKQSLVERIREAE